MSESKETEVSKAPAAALLKRAWRFEYAGSLKGMKKALDAFSSSPWEMGDSPRLGHFLKKFVPPDSIARICAAKDGYVVQLESHRVDYPMLFESAQMTLVQEILPHIRAENVQDCELLDDDAPSATGAAQSESAAPQLNFCDGTGILIGGKRELPSDPTVCDDGYEPIRGCSRLRCANCGQMLRNVPGRREHARDQIHPAALYKRADLASAPVLEKSNDSRFYLCSCDSRHVDSQEFCYDRDSLYDFPQWSCAGHPVAARPRKSSKGAGATKRPQTKDLLGTLKAKEDCVLSPDRRWLATGDVRVELWDMEEGRLRHALDSGITTRLEFTPDSTRLLVITYMTPQSGMQDEVTERTYDVRAGRFVNERSWWERQ